MNFITFNKCASKKPKQIAKTEVVKCKIHSKANLLKVVKFTHRILGYFITAKNGNSTTNDIQGEHRKKQATKLNKQDTMVIGSFKLTCETAK